MNLDEELKKTQEEINEAKENISKSLVPVDTAATKEEDKSQALKLIDEQEKQLVNTDEVKAVAARIGNERLHSDFEEEAAKIEKKNTDNQQLIFDNKKKKRKIQREEAEEELEHKYKMQEIKKNAEHKQMLDKRKKLVEKYGYLYDNTKITKAYDSDGKEYNVPEDFSYSETVNKFRQFGRNVSKLDRPLVQTIKWIFIIGGIIAVICVLKSFNIL